MSGGRHYDQDKESTVYVGNLDERVTDAIIWELFVQMGPVVNVHLPKDRVSMLHQGYGFVEFSGEQDAEYACQILNQIRVYGKQIRVNKASADKRGATGEANENSHYSVGAELFIGNLDGVVDERMIYDTFHRFGPLVAPPKITRDENGLSKGYGFVSYASFEASDDAIANMHGKFFWNKEVTVAYAYKKDGKGERHGDAAERALAAEAKKNGVEVAIPAMPAYLVYPTGAPAGPAVSSTFDQYHAPMPSASQGYTSFYPNNNNMPPPPARPYSNYPPPPASANLPPRPMAPSTNNMPGPPSTGGWGPPPGAFPPQQG